MNTTDTIYYTETILLATDEVFITKLVLLILGQCLLSSGKSCGYDGVAGEHFKYAHKCFNVYLSMLFTSVISHGYVPEAFMKTVLLPIVKSKSGDMSDVNNYRPIALVTASSKIFEIYMLDQLDVYLSTASNQFGFKRNHSTDMCIFAIKNVVDYYRKQHSPVFTCFLNASKAFDRVNHWTLFKKLLDRNIPLVLVRVVIYWYRHQTFCVKWGTCISNTFTTCNGVRQGGILSPKLFALYLDDLSTILNKSGVGCFIDIWINHLFYADDLCLLAPSAMGLQQLIDICCRYGEEHDIILNALKSYYVVFKPAKYKLLCPSISISGTVMDVCNIVKYLGILICDSLTDNNEIMKQMRGFYARANTILRNFNMCSIYVKVELFRAYCTNFYCCSLWSSFSLSTISKMRVAYNNVVRRLLGYSRRDSASNMFVTNNLPSFDVLLRRNIYGFKTRIEKL